MNSDAKREGHYPQFLNGGWWPTPAVTTNDSPQEEEDTSKMVYICHPFGGDVLGNTEKVKEICMGVMELALNGKRPFDDIIPMAPQLMFPTFADDKDPDQREWAMNCSIEILFTCDELWVMYTGKEAIVTPGMRAEIEAASDAEIPIRWVDLNNLEDYDVSTD